VLLLLLRNIFWRQFEAKNANRVFCSRKKRVTSPRHSPHNVRFFLVCEKEKKENYSAEATNRKSPPGRPDAHNESPHFRPARPPGCPQPISTNFRDGASGRFRTSALRAASKCRHFLGLQNVGASRHLDVKVVHGRPSTNPTLLSVKT